MTEGPAEPSREREAVRAARQEGPVLVFVAGPNGSGKSTFIETYLGDLGLPYVNADRIARAIRAGGMEASGDEIDRLAFTQAELNSPTPSSARVLQRVRLGGHDVAGGEEVDPRCP